MGAWAEDAFGNDSACDWAAGFSDDPSLEKLEAALDIVIEMEEYLDSYEACEALVACEIVARLKGNWGQKSAYSESVDQWVESVKTTPNDELVVKAERVITRVLGDDSELKELWNEDGKNEAWHAEMDSLLLRVKS